MIGVNIFSEGSYLFYVNILERGYYVNKIKYFLGLNVYWNLNEDV